jgi:hypothetical protein
MKLKISFMFLSCLVILSVAGCGSKVYMHPLLTADPSDPSTEVYFFREDTLAGSGVPTEVYLGGGKLLQLRKAKYAKVRLKAGTHEVEIRSGRAVATKSMTFAAGETSFLLLKHGCGGILFAFCAEPITEAGAKSLMATMTEIP